MARSRWLAGLVVPALADRPRPCAERGCPGRDVGALPARADVDLGVGVAALREPARKAHDDVERVVSQGADERRHGP